MTGKALQKGGPADRAGKEGELAAGNGAEFSCGGSAGWSKGGIASFRKKKRLGRRSIKRKVGGDGRGKGRPEDGVTDEVQHEDGVPSDRKHFHHVPEGRGGRVLFVSSREKRERDTALRKHPPPAPKKKKKKKTNQPHPPTPRTKKKKPPHPRGKDTIEILRSEERRKEPLLSPNKKGDEEGKIKSARKQL